MFLDSFTSGVDALAQNWRQPASGAATSGPAAAADGGAYLVNYAFPPISLVWRVVRLVMDQRAPTLMVVPRWESQPWWPLIAAHAEVRPLGRTRDGIFQAAGYGLRAHPLGGAADPAAVEWVAAMFAFRTRA
jgi:hypothetical protein